MAVRKCGNRSGCSTREQVLRAACRVFAEKGYAAATIAEICDKAGANIAAVNYHYGGKATLYVEAWRSAFQRSLKAYPPDGGIPADAPPADRLRGRVLALMHRVHDPENYEFRLVRKELANPTGLLDEVVQQCLSPMREAMAGIVRELLGPDASEVSVLLCTRSIGSQCLHMLMHGQGGLGSPRFGRKPGGAADLDVQTIADHVVRFSLAGIREMARDGRPDGPGKAGAGT